VTRADIQCAVRIYARMWKLVLQHILRDLHYMGRSALYRELVSYSWCASLRLRIVVVRVEEFDEFLDEGRLVDREVNLICFRLLLHS
jgi:hypothetical protein